MMMKENKVFIAVSVEPRLDGLRTRVRLVGRCQSTHLAKLEQQGENGGNSRLPVRFSPLADLLLIDAGKR